MTFKAKYIQEIYLEEINNMKKVVLTAVIIESSVRISVWNMNFTRAIISSNSRQKVKESLAIPAGWA